MSLEWSSDYPKEPGMYWVRHKGQNIEIVSLSGDPGNLKMLFMGSRIGIHLLPKDWNWQWAGPIPRPPDEQNRRGRG